MGRAQRKYYKGNGNKIMEVREFVLCFKGCLTFNQKTNIRKFIFCLNVKDGFEKRIWILRYLIECYRNDPDKRENAGQK